MIDERRRVNSQNVHICTVHFSMIIPVIVIAKQNDNTCFIQCIYDISPFSVQTWMPINWLKHLFMSCRCFSSFCFYVNTCEYHRIGNLEPQCNVISIHVSPQHIPCLSVDAECDVGAMGKSDPYIDWICMVSGRIIWHRWLCYFPGAVTRWVSRLCCYILPKAVEWESVELRTTCALC